MGCSEVCRRYCKSHDNNLLPEVYEAENAVRYITNIANRIYNLMGRPAAVDPQSLVGKGLVEFKKKLEFYNPDGDASVWDFTYRHLMKEMTSEIMSATGELKVPLLIADIIRDKKCDFVGSSLKNFEYMSTTDGEPDCLDIMSMKERNTLLHEVIDNMIGIKYMNHKRKDHELRVAMKLVCEGGSVSDISDELGISLDSSVRLFRKASSAIKSAILKNEKLADYVRDML